jgi:hypothetical protein
MRAILGVCLQVKVVDRCTNRYNTGSIPRLPLVNPSPPYRKWQTGKESPSEHGTRLGRNLPQRIPTFAISNTATDYFLTRLFSSFSPHLSPLSETQLSPVCDLAPASTYFYLFFPPFLMKSYRNVDFPFTDGGPQAMPTWMSVCSYPAVTFNYIAKEVK